MKKSFRQILTVCLAAFLILALSSCASVVTKNANKVTGDLSGKTVILHSNDVHGAIEGYTYIAAAKKAFEAQGATVILVDAGDFSQGTVEVSANKGANGVLMMNAVGYDVATLGNHEFDYGYAQLKANLENAEFAVTCADVFEKGKTIYDEFVVFDVDGVKIAFIGFETPEAKTKTNPSLIQGLNFASNQETGKYNLNKVAQKAINKASKQADIVIALSHLGVDKESEENECAIYNVWNNTTGLDFVIDGHSHTIMKDGRSGEPIQSTGTAFANIGVVVIDNATKSIETNYLLSTKDYAKDATVAAVASAIKDQIAAEYNKVFATSKVALDGVKGNVRSKETNMGDLICDSMIWTVLKNGSIAVADDHVVAVTNGGGIRASIGAGDVTKYAVNTVLPFGNTIAVNYISGAELLEALEASTYCTPTTVGGFPQVSGIEYTIDTSKKFDEGSVYPGSEYHAPKSIKRVTITAINGKPFSLTDTYAVVTNNFCAAGGDTYYAFKAANDAGNCFDTSIPLDQGLMEYISVELGGVIGDSYAKPAGRITIK